MAYEIDETMPMQLGILDFDAEPEVDEEGRFKTAGKVVPGFEHLPPPPERPWFVEKLDDLTEEVAKYLRLTISRTAKELRPNLEDIGGSKATVKFGIKLGIKNGKLTSVVTEVA